MTHVVLVKVGELHLKGLNRPFFEKRLIRNIKSALSGLNCKVNIAQSRIFVYGIPDDALDDALAKLTRVFGIHAVSPAIELEKDYDVISANLIKVLKDKQLTSGTFKVKARRADKSYPMQSPELAAKLGADILREFPALKVDLDKPDHVFEVEIREKAYIYAEDIPGPGGLPVGTSGKATLLVSGGIDSPVAGYMIAKRGVVLEAVHFHSFPHTSLMAKEKVISLVKKLSEYCGPIKLHIVPFTKLQETIYEKCNERFLTIIMRRYMMKIADAIAQNNRSTALITGESIGQVASQTMDALYATNQVVSMPVYRPLIGFDKLDIMALAKQIGTYDISILPYEDCCTVFTPRHPATHPKIEEVIESEQAFDSTELMKEAIENTEVLTITPDYAG